MVLKALVPCVNMAKRHRLLNISQSTYRSLTWDLSSEMNPASHQDYELTKPNLPNLPTLRTRQVTYNVQSNLDVDPSASSPTPPTSRPTLPSRPIQPHNSIYQCLGYHQHGQFKGARAQTTRAAAHAPCSHEPCLRPSSCARPFTAPETKKCHLLLIEYAP